MSFENAIFRLSRTDGGGVAARWRTVSVASDTGSDVWNRGRRAGSKRAAGTL